MEEKKLTAQEWADMNAEALTLRNRELLLEMVEKLSQPAQHSVEDEKSHWRKVFAAAAIQNGKTPDEALSVANEMIVLMF